MLEIDPLEPTVLPVDPVDPEPPVDPVDPVDPGNNGNDGNNENDGKPTSDLGFEPEVSSAVRSDAQTDSETDIQMDRHMDRQRRTGGRAVSITDLQTDGLRIFPNYQIVKETHLIIFVNRGVKWRRE